MIRFGRRMSLHFEFLCITPLTFVFVTFAWAQTNEDRDIPLLSDPFRHDQSVLVSSHSEFERSAIDTPVPLTLDSPSQHADHIDDGKFQLRYGYSDPNFPGRNIGKGIPLVGTSWLNRPHHADAFIGGLFGDTISNQQVEQRGGVFTGLRLGWDLDHYWGIETRFGYSKPRFTNGSRGTVQMFDANVQYYPFGDAVWRPYFSLGSGIARYSFIDGTGQSVNDVLYQLPIGVGVKYLARRWLALRFQVLDNVGISSSGTGTVHNISMSGGVEWHFGGPRRSYFPFESDGHYW